MLLTKRSIDLTLDRNGMTFFVKVVKKRVTTHERSVCNEVPNLKRSFSTRNGRLKHNGYAPADRKAAQGGFEASEADVRRDSNTTKGDVLDLTLNIRHSSE